MNERVNRRTFLETTGAALAAGTLANVLSADDTTSTNNHGLRKAVKYTMVGVEGTILDKFKLLKSLGFEGVDINTRLDHDEVNAAQKESGLIVHGVVGYDHWRKPLSDPDPAVRKEGRESFEGAIRDAKAYGGTSALLVPGRCTKEVSYEEAFKRSRDEIREMIPLAEELNIQILIENVWNDYLISPLDMARFVDELESPVMGVYFDVGNVVRYGWPEHWIRNLGSRIKKLDIKEYSRKLQNEKGPRAGFGVKLGEGDCDWPAVMKALADIGYKGWATAEVSGGNEERLREISERMDKIFAS